MTTAEFSCEMCNKHLKTLKNLDKHRRLHKRINRLECDYCGCIYSNKTEISHHIDIHRRYSILECKVCRSSFTTAKILKDHLKKYISPRICEFCGKSFARTVELKLHIDSKHLIVLRFPCSCCERNFATLKAQREHETRIHQTKKNAIYECLQCKKSFPLRESLRIHSFEHYEGKVFNCSIENCKKFFKTEASLKLHVKSHSKVKQYHCNRCKKSFIQSSGLGKHLKRCNFVVKAPQMNPEEIIRIAKAQYQEILYAKGRTLMNKNLSATNRLVESKLEQAEIIEFSGDDDMGRR